MKTQTFSAAQRAYDNELPPEDNLFTSYLESLTLEELLDYGAVGNDYTSVSDTEEYQAELASRPAPENAYLELDYAPFFHSSLIGKNGTVYVYDSNRQTEHTVTEYPWWLRHALPGWTLLTSFRCAETVLNDYQTYLLTTGDL